MRKIKVMILVDKFDYHGSYINGPARYFSWVVQRLDKERFDVHLCSLRGKGRSDEIFREENVAVTYLDLSRYSPLTITAILMLIKKKEIDLLHLSGYGSCAFGRIAALMSGKPAIVQEHWVDPGFGGVLAIIERLLAKATTRAIAISDYAQDFLIQKKGIAEHTITLIRNGIPLEMFNEVDEQRGLEKRRELRIPIAAKVIGVVGMLQENKGHRYFVEAAALLRPKHPDARFVIVGDGEERSSLEHQVAALGLNGYVEFIGHQNDMPAILQMLDIFVMSSISETAPLSLLEAMASGKAIVATDCGGPSEVIRHGENGFLVPIRSANAISDSIHELLTHRQLQTQFGKRAREDSERYDIQTTVRRIEEVYRSVVEDGIVDPTLREA